MSTFVLVPGAGGAGWYWHRLVPELERLGHQAVAVDSREDDPRLGLPDYADAVVAAIGAHRDVILVGQSLGELPPQRTEDSARGLSRRAGRRAGRRPEPAKAAPGPR